MLLGGAQPHVQIEIGEGDGAAVSVFGGRLTGHFDRRLGCGRRGLRRGLAVLVDGAGKDNLAFGLSLGGCLGGRVRGWWRRGSSLRCAGENFQTESCYR